MAAQSCAEVTKSVAAVFLSALLSLLKRGNTIYSASDLFSFMGLVRCSTVAGVIHGIYGAVGDQRLGTALTVASIARFKRPSNELGAVSRRTF